MQNEGKGPERVRRATQTGIRRQKQGTAMSALVKLNQVSKSFIRGKEELHVLNDIDLAIEKGDFFALMGPSGSGKTTLLNLIGGLDTTTAGYVQVGDTRLDELSSKELARWRSEHVGFVFQFYNLLPVLTAQRNVELPLLLTRLSRSQRKSNAATALKVVGLEDRADHRPGELSGGQQQRVAIARAFVADPEILVCDEPTGDLDRDTADEILGLLELLNRDHGKTIIMVTHDPKAAEHASHVLHLDKGRLVDQVST
jgi:putative ABC transport system ATP-binding protein